MDLPKTTTKSKHPNRVSGMSGRTVGKMLRAANHRSKPNSEHRPLRARNQPKPMGRNRFPEGKYQPMGDA
jgi:hypothetical protein